MTAQGVVAYFGSFTGPDHLFEHCPILGCNCSDDEYGWPEDEAPCPAT